MDRVWAGRWTSVSVWALLLVAALLRLVNLNFHSLDLDESVSVWLAQKPTGELIANTLNLAWDPHPPGYYVMLRCWIGVFGSGELSVRLLSALLGICLVWFLYLVGAHLFDPWVGVIAGGLGAINPLLVWLAQEVRMYTAVAVLTLGSIYCLIRALDEHHWWWWLGYVLLALSGSYCHLFASLMLPVAALYVLVRGWQRPALWVWGMLAIGGVAAAYTPFARNAWKAGQVAPEINVYPRLDFGEQLYELLKSFATRFLPRPPQWLWLPMALLVVTTVLALWPTRRGEQTGQGRAPRWLLLVWLVIPLVAFLWINAKRPAFSPKYLTAIVPAFWLAVAAGISRVRRWRLWVVFPALAPALLTSALGWRYVWSTEALREDWRTAAGYVSQRAVTDDQVFVHVHYAHIPFDYYYDGMAQVYAPLGSRPPASDDLDGLLAPYSGANVLWLVQAQEHNTDPKHVIEQWFSERGPMVTEQYPAGMSVKAFALNYRLSGVPGTAVPAQIGFGPHLRLAGYQLDQSHLRPDSDRLHPPSNWIHLTLYWQIDQPLEGDFETIVEMTDDTGGVWGGKLDQPRNVLQFHPPSRWQPGEVIRDDYDINLNPVTPTGMYHLRVGVRLPSGDGMPWPVSGAATSDARAVLTDVQIDDTGRH